jgi:hypothetical protein
MSWKMATGASQWVPTLADPAAKESLAQRLSYELGAGVRVRTVGEDGHGNYVMTAFNKKTGAYKRLIVTPSPEAEVQYKVAEQSRLKDAIALVRQTELERGHHDIKKIELVKPTDSGDGLVLKVSYKTAGKKPRQFEVDFGHPLEPSAKDLVMHYSADYNAVTDRHMLQLIEKATDQLLGNHDWVHEAHRLPSLTTSRGTTIVSYGEDWGAGGQKTERVNVTTAQIDPKNRTIKSAWNVDGNNAVIDYTPAILAAVTAKTGQPASLGSHLENEPSDFLKEQNNTLRIVTHNGNVRVHSAGKDYVVNMERLLAGKKTDLVMPDT